ncbi:MAG: cya 3, partial [Phycisphaerales bacterium]|nr:cya 3 [Phycisphaerales bacterium]
MLIENLETRRLLSVSLDPASKLLTINGTNDPDAITVTVQSGQLKVTDNGVVTTFPLPAVKKLAVNAKAGADVVTLAPSVLLPSAIDTGTGAPGGQPGDQVQGGGGNDVISVKGDFETVSGGAGDDALYNYGGFNRLYGEAGNDTLAGRGPSTISSESGYNGGAGVDTLDFSAATTGLVMRNGTFGYYFKGPSGPPIVSGDAADSATSFENFYGGAGADYLYGTDGNNILKGNGGNDYLGGGGGADFLYGGAGQNALFGNDGNDTFYTKNGIKDYLEGGAGTDKANKDAIDVLNSVE